MMNSLSRYIKTLLAVTLVGIAMTSCTDDFDTSSVKDLNSGEGGIGIGFRCTEMVETFYGSHNPASRAADNKATEEKEIKSIHLFFFNPDNGELLEPADYDNFKSYMYREKTDKANEDDKVVNPSFLSVPFSAGDDGKNTVVLFKNQPADGVVKVVAIANIDAVDDGINMFNTKWEGNNSGTICEAGRTHSDDNPILTVGNYSDLEKWTYYPPIRMSDDGVSGDITKLPASGMPMIGEGTVNILTKQDETPVIKMKALMAKVNISVELDPDQYTSQYPLLTITEYGVRNMPIAVPFVAPKGTLKENQADFVPAPGTNIEDTYPQYFEKYDVTSVPMYHHGETTPGNIHFVCDDAAHEFTTKVNVTINKDSEPVTFSYYTFENINLPDYNALRADGTNAFNTNLEPQYPTDANGNVIVKDEDKQRWKSTFAYSDRASALILKGRYTTHQGITYNAEFSVYMGENADIDFQVKRNHQYDNNIVIHGLDYIRNSADNVYNFDGRVNVYDTENPLYLAIVNELKVDAHATALPMDVWLMLRENGTYQQESPEVDHYTEVTVTIPEEDRNFVQMVLIPRSEMEREINGEKFEAGRGAEKYFYVNLLNDIRQRPDVVLNGGENGAYEGHDDGAQCGSEVKIVSTPGANGGELNNSRSRVYFYIDENVNGGDRGIHVKVDYKSYKLENGVETDVRTFTRYVDIEQKGLLPVDNVNISNTTTQNIVPSFMEYYEEYLEHNDPLDRHEQPGEFYTGLPWGLTGLNCRDFNNSEAGNNYYQIYASDGAYPMTTWAINQSGHSINEVELFNMDKPHSAFHYCYGRNKRNYDGSVPTTGGHWYMPGIRELEQALQQYYNVFTDEFSNNFYWSCAAARRAATTLGDSWGNYDSRSEYARSTKIIVNATGAPTYVPSNMESNNSHGDGCKLRTESLRIRAFYRKN